MSKILVSSGKVTTMMPSMIARLSTSSNLKSGTSANTENGNPTPNMNAMNDPKIAISASMDPNCINRSMSEFSTHDQVGK